MYFFFQETFECIFYIFFFLSCTTFDRTLKVLIVYIKLFSVPTALKYCSKYIGIPIVIKDSFDEHTARKYLIKLKHKVCAGCEKETISIFHSDLKNASLVMQV